MKLRTSTQALISLMRSLAAHFGLGAVMFAVVIFLIEPPRIAFAAGDPVVAQVQIPIPGFNFDPTRWVQDAFGALLQTFSDGIRTGMDALWAANFITQTPRSLTYANEDIRGLHGIMQGAANAALALIATMGALNVLLRPHLGLRYHSLSEFVPRLLLARSW